MQSYSTDITTVSVFLSLSKLSAQIHDLHVFVGCEFFIMAKKKVIMGPGCEAVLYKPDKQTIGLH